MQLRSVRVLAVAIVALLAGLAPAAAQITTGTVTGNVKDSQGGVIPGATVVLISDSRGTKLAPAVTNETGDFVVANVTPDRYTVEVTMDGFKTVRRSGVAVSGGDRIGVPSITLEAGTIAETVNVTAEAATRPVAERRALLRGDHRADREPSDQPRELHQPDGVHPGRRLGRRLGRRHAPRRREPEQHHDGRHLGHGHRQQRPDAQHEHRVDRRGQDPHPGLPGGVRALERPADHRGDQERHQPLPRVRLQRR